MPTGRLRKDRGGRDSQGMEGENHLTIFHG
jgi:hypothetical protein